MKAIAKSRLKSWKTRMFVMKTVVCLIQINSKVFVVFANVFEVPR